MPKSQLFTAIFVAAEHQNVIDRLKDGFYDVQEAFELEADYDLAIKKLSNFYSTHFDALQKTGLFDGFGRLYTALAQAEEAYRDELQNQRINRNDHNPPPVLCSESDDFLQKSLSLFFLDTFNQHKTFVEEFIKTTGWNCLEVFQKAAPNYRIAIDAFASFYTEKRDYLKQEGLLEHASDFHQALEAANKAFLREQERLHLKAEADKRAASFNNTKHVDAPEKEVTLFELSKTKVKGENSQKDMENLLVIVEKYRELEQDKTKKSQFRADLRKHAAAGLNFSLEKDVSLAKYLASNPFEGKDVTTDKVLMHYRFFLEIVEQHAKQNVLDLLEHKKFDELADLVNSIHTLVKNCEGSKIEDVLRLSGQFKLALTDIITLWFGSIKTSADYAASIAALENFRPSLLDVVIVRETLLERKWKPDFISALKTQADYAKVLAPLFKLLTKEPQAVTKQICQLAKYHSEFVLKAINDNVQIVTQLLSQSNKLKEDRINSLVAEKAKLNNLVVDITIDQLPVFQLLGRLHAGARQHFADADFMPAIQFIAALSPNDIHSALLQLLQVCLTKSAETFPPLVNKIVLLFMVLKKPDSAQYVELLRLLSGHKAYLPTVEDVLRIRVNSLQTQEERNEFVASLNKAIQTKAFSQAKALISPYIEIANAGSAVLKPVEHSLSMQITCWKDYQTLLVEAVKSDNLDSVLIKELFTAALEQAKTASEMINLSAVCADNAALLKALAQNLYQRFPDIKHLKTLMNRVNKPEVVAEFIDQMIAEKTTDCAALNAKDYQQLIQEISYPFGDSSLKIDLIQHYFDYCGQQQDPDTEYQHFIQCLVANNLLPLFITSILPGVVAKTLENEATMLEKAEQFQWLINFMQQKVVPYTPIEASSELQISIEQQCALLEARWQEETHQNSVNELLKTQGAFNTYTAKQIKRLKELKTEVEQYKLLITPIGEFIDIGELTHLRKEFEDYSNAIQREFLAITAEIDALESAAEIERATQLPFKDNLGIYTKLTDKINLFAQEKNRFIQSEGQINQLAAQVEVKLVNLREGLITQNGKFNTIFTQKKQALLDEIAQYEKTEQQQIQSIAQLENIDIPKCKRELAAKKEDITGIKQTLETRRAELTEEERKGSILSGRRVAVNGNIKRNYGSENRKNDGFFKSLDEIEGLFDVAIDELRSQRLYDTVFQPEKARREAAIQNIKKLFDTAINENRGQQFLECFEAEKKLWKQVIVKPKFFPPFKTSLEQQDRDKLKEMLKEFKGQVHVHNANPEIKPVLVESDVVKQQQQQALQAAIAELSPKDLVYSRYRTWKFHFFRYFAESSPIPFIREFANSVVAAMRRDDNRLEPDIQELQRQKERLSNLKSIDFSQTRPADLRNVLTQIDPKNDWKTIYQDSRLNFWERFTAKRKVESFIKKKEKAQEKFSPLSATQATEEVVLEDKQALNAAIEKSKVEKLKAKNELNALERKQHELETQLNAVNEQLLVTQTTLKNLSECHGKLIEPYNKIFDANQSNSSRLVEILYLALSDEEKLAQLKEEAAKKPRVPKFVMAGNGVHLICASPLYHAVLKGTTAEMVEIVLKAMNLNEEEKQIIFEESIVDDNGLPVSVLLKAMQLGRIETVKILLKEKAANKNQQVMLDKKGSWTTLLLWAYQYQNEMVDTLIGAGADVNATDSLGNTLLHLAGLNGDIDRITKLLANDQFTGVDSKNNQGDTALALVATSLSLLPEVKYQLMTLLLAKMKTLPAILEDNHNTYFAGLDEEGNTFLHRAILDNNLSLIDWLLNGQNSVLLNTLNNNGVSPLTLAVKNNNLPIITSLLQQPQLMGIHEAFSLALRDKNCPETVVALFLKSNNVDIKANSHFYLSCCRNLKHFQLLVKQGARIDVADEKGNTLLHQAVIDGDLAKVKFLIEECGMEPHPQNSQGVMPLMQLYKREGCPKNRDLVNYLMGKTSANRVIGFFRGDASELLAKSDELGNNLLHYAVRAGDINAIKILAKKPPFWMKENPLDKQNKDGDSAIHLVVNSSFDDATIVEILGLLFQEGQADLNQLDAKSRSPICYVQSSLIAKYLVEKRGKRLTKEELNLLGRNILKNQRIKDSDKEKIIKDIAIDNHYNDQAEDIYKEIARSVGKSKEYIKIELQKVTLPDGFSEYPVEKKKAFLQEYIVTENIANVAEILDMGIPIPEAVINNAEPHYVDFPNEGNLSEDCINWVEVLLTRQEKLLTVQDYRTGNTLLHSLVLLKKETEIAHVAKEGGMYVTEKNKDGKTVLTLARELAHKRKILPTINFSPLFKSDGSKIISSQDGVNASIYTNTVTTVKNRLVFELKFQCEKQLEIEKLIEIRKQSPELELEQLRNSEKQEQLYREQIEKSQAIVKQIIADLDFGQYTEAAMLVDVFAELKDIKGGIEATKCLWELKDRLKNPAAAILDGSSTIAEALLTRNPKQSDNQKLLLGFLQASDIAGRGNSLNQLADCKTHIEEEIKIFRARKERFNYRPNRSEIEQRLDNSAACSNSLKTYQELCGKSNHLFESDSVISSLKTAPEKQQLANARNMMVHIGLFIEANIDELVTLPSITGLKLPSLLAFAREKESPALYIGVVEGFLTALGMQNPVALVKEEQELVKAAREQRKMAVYHRAENNSPTAADKTLVVQLNV